MNETVIIETSRKKQFKYILLLIAVILISVHGIMNPYHKYSNQFSPTRLTIAIIGFVMFVMLLAALIHLMITRKNVLEIDEKCFINNSGIIWTDNILWENVEKIFIGPESKDKSVFIELKDTETFLKTVTPLRRKFLKFGLKSGPTITSVSCVYAKKDKKYVLSEMKKQFNKWKKENKLIEQ